MTTETVTSKVTAISGKCHYDEQKVGGSGGVDFHGIGRY